MPTLRNRWIILLCFCTACAGPRYHIRGAELDRLAALDTDGPQVVRALQSLALRNGRPTVLSESNARTAIQQATPRERDVAQAPPDSLSEVRAHQESGLPSVTVGRTTESPPIRGSSVGARASSGAASAGGAAVGGLVAYLAGIIFATPLTMMMAEATRHDGWLQVDESQPLYLYRGRLGREWIRIRTDELTPQRASWADGAHVRADEGNLQLLARAPLNRRGVTFQFGGGISGFQAGGLRVPSFAGRVGLGVFPHHRFGLVVQGLFAGARGLSSQGVAGDAQLYPLEFRRWHFGFYGRVGLRRFFDKLEEGESDWRRQVFGGGGLLLQYDATTRSAVEFQLGLHVVERQVFGEASVGVSVF